MKAAQAAVAASGSLRLKIISGYQPASERQTVTAPNSSRGTYASNNTDNAGLVVVWEWVPSGGAESGNLTIDVLADLPGAYSAGDEPGNRKLVISGLAQ